MIKLILAFVFSFLFITNNTNPIYSSKEGSVKFVSNAPLEIIKAESNKLVSVIDAQKRTFAFTIPVKSFLGFNSPLQKEHFNENYMESDKFPIITFKGKIIEEIDFSVSGTHNLRAKGIISIHGIEKEKIINSKISIKNDQIELQSQFDVLLVDHNIRIPKVVNQKIAEIISIEVNTHLLSK
ncbi:MAG: YceI family protein [Bacteroidetes bacterium]|nr:YceI family protein [Bacteroidota bacterium]HET6244758.1 YceI family protein [Bacteroidia bacterium]